MFSFNKKVAITLMLGLLAVSAFFIRWDNFKKSPNRSIDEIVFFRMAGQVSHNWQDYNTIPYGKELQASGRELPEYFFRPLYKHPPLFTFLLAGMMKLFGNSLNIAAIVPLLLGALLIPLVYLLANAIFNDRRTACLAALFMWFDPVSTICSQKIWMDVPLCFFSLLAIYFFVKALQSSSVEKWLLLSGLTIGLAMNIKYTAVLILAAQWLYILIYRPDLRCSIKFWLLNLLPFILLIPWMIWNLKIYGRISTPFSEDDFMHLFKTYAFKLSSLIVIISLIMVGIHKLKSKFPFVPSPAFTSKLNWIVYTILAALLSSAFVNTFNLYHIPKNTWAGGLLAMEPSTFYFSQLIEFSPLYILSFILLFKFEATPKTPLISILKLTLALSFIFFIVWGNFQSRYILSAVPGLIILSSEQFIRWCDAVKSQNNLLLRSFMRASLLLLICFIILKTSWINIHLSFPNNMCYF
ncbi:MAG: glycosyltransferase family 39 protein [Candidatus Omnitrophica bacterium]|nr:glycosyltransferase family 39 protein [Candidatus Omnitrophota bacterium]